MTDYKPCTPQTCAQLFDRSNLICGEGCDTSIINLCCWQFLYQSHIAEHNGNYILRFMFDGSFAYALRFKPCDLKEIIDILSHEARTGGYPLRIMGVNESMLPYYNEAAPGRFTANYSPDYSDYVYDRNSLATLAGKKLQSKRNFVNRFKRMYEGYEYRPLTVADAEACLALDKSWINKGLDLGHTDEERNERECIKYVFAHWEELHARGGLIKVDGQLVAFTYGAPIDDERFDVCVEKADTAYEGAYAIINHEFVNHLPEQYKWINREEDLGIEGLRKVKNAYQPAIRLHKYLLTEN